MQAEALSRERGSESPWSTEKCAAVWAAADHILADVAFKKSRRCVILFRRLVEHALEGGDEDGIKERTLGIEVFGREVDYDTNTDPIVRMTANEIRKRLAQYYQSTNSPHKIHIGLLPGSYVLRFEFASDPTSIEAAPQPREEAPFPPNPTPKVAEIGSGASDPEPALLPRSGSRKKTIAATVTVICVVAIGAALSLSWPDWTVPFRSNQYLLWSPLLKPSQPIAICIADLLPIQFKDKDWAHIAASMIAGNAPPPLQVDQSASPSTPTVDTEVATHVSASIQSYGRPFKVARSSTLTLDDFRHQPVVLIGGFDNFWTMTLLSKLRYHIQIDPVTQEEWIEDRQNLANRDWKGSGKMLYGESSVDFALITRIWDQDTGNWILAAGGLGMHGTEVAGDLISDPEYSRVLPDAVRSGKKNIQIVVKTTVISGHTGAPQVIAVYTW